MADELLEALAQRQREADAAKPPIPLDDFEGEAGDALLGEMFGELDDKAGQNAALSEGPPPQTEAAPDNVTALPKRSPAVWAGAGILIAAAAAMVLWLAMPSSEDPLPAYGAVSIAGGPAAVRGEHEDVPEVLKLGRPSDNIEWRFAPATSVKADIEVVLSARRADGERVFATVPNPAVTPTGSVQLRGPLDAFIELGRGHWTVEVLFARSGHAPGSAEEAMQGDWPRLTIKVIIDAS